MEKEFDDFSPKMDYLTIALVCRLYIVRFYCVKAKIMKMYFILSKERKTISSSWPLGRRKKIEESNNCISEKKRTSQN